MVNFGYNQGYSVRQAMSALHEAETTTSPENQTDEEHSMIPITKAPLALAAAFSGLLVAGTLQAAPALTPIDTMDKDNSGTVSEAEFNAARKAQMENRARMGRPVQNPDLGPAFSDIDTNGDGEASLDEFRAMRMEIMARRQAALELARRERMRQMMQNMPPPPSPGMMQPRPSFDDLDTNRDGVISRDEYNRGYSGR
jgi:hypothetical protein